MPFNVDEPNNVDCIFCGAKQYPDALDLLSEPSLQFVRETRDGQIEMCKEIIDAMSDHVPGIFEAGTGVGKSFAYLLPAILSGERVVISTAKKTLQNQLLEKDLPHIRDFLKKIGHVRSIFTFEGAYGRNNYACYLLLRKKHEGSRRWATYEKFFKVSKYGLWDDAHKHRLKIYDTSDNATNCIGIECEHYKHCGFIGTRSAVHSADIVVTNNWLLGYHYKSIRDGNRVPYLGTFSYLIVDEAHKVEDGIRDAFTLETSLSHVDTLHDTLNQINNFSQVVVPNDNINKLATDINVALGLLQKTTDTHKELTGTARTACQYVIDRLSKIREDVLHPDVLPRLFTSPGSETLRAFMLRKELGQGWAENTPGIFPSLPDDQSLYLSLHKHLKTMDDCYAAFSSLLQLRNNRVWAIETVIENKKPKTILKDMPVEIGAYMPHTDVTYVSATLAHNGSFNTFVSRMGLLNKPYRANIFPSPFNIARQAYLYLPNVEDMPEPVNGLNHPDRNTYLDKLGHQIQQLLEASRGDAMVLFTAKSELSHVHNYLKQNNYPYPLFAQGQNSNQSVFAAYQRTPQAALLGLKSFWEGIDIQGSKLFLVIIAKLPMPSESDPIIRARMGANTDPWFAFMRVKYPEMVSDLRQGLGRLIRSKTDRGVVAILDTRLRTKRYGKSALAAVGLRPISDLEKMCKAIRTRHDS